MNVFIVIIFMLFYIIVCIYNYDNIWINNKLLRWRVSDGTKIYLQTWSELSRGTGTIVILCVYYYYNFCLFLYIMYVIIYVYIAAKYSFFKMQCALFLKQNVEPHNVLQIGSKFKKTFHEVTKYYLFTDNKHENLCVYYQLLISFW